MPYAARGRIGQAPIEGGIEITEAQYAEALAGMLEGKAVTIRDGALVVALPSKPDPEPEPEPGPPTVNDYRSAIQAHLDASAQSRNYDSGTTISTYVNSTNPTWAAEAQAFVAWRDAVWAYAYLELDKVTTGARPQPSVEDLVAELPEVDWSLTGDL